MDEPSITYRMDFILMDDEVAQALIREIIKPYTKRLKISGPILTSINNTLEYYIKLENIPAVVFVISNNIIRLNDFSLSLSDPEMLNKFRNYLDDYHERVKHSTDRDILTPFWYRGKHDNTTRR